MKNRFLILLLFAGIFCAQGATACLNENEPIPGVISFGSGEIFRLIPKETDATSLWASVREFDSCKTKLSPGCSDLVVAYLYLMQVDSAVYWSKKLLQKYPDEYNVVINYAVALELQGNLKEALAYMKKALAINPDSHFGSEWIHQRILENYIAGNTQPKQSILALDFGNDSLPVRPDSLSNVTRLLTELHYQLEDRLFFMQQSDKKDPLFGSLLYDYANLLFLEGYIDFAPDYFAMAEKYGYTHPALAKRQALLTRLSAEKTTRLAEEYQREERQVDFKRNLHFFGITVSAFILALAVVFVLRYKTRAQR